MRVYTDAARDDRIVATGWKIILSDGTEQKGNRFLNEQRTSMEAEYMALLDGLRFARRFDEARVEVFVDCQPLLTKMRVPDENKDWYDRRRGCHRLLNKFDEWSMEWTPRKHNSDADEMASLALERGRDEQ